MKNRHFARLFLVNFSTKVQHNLCLLFTFFYLKKTARKCSSKKRRQHLLFVDQTRGLCVLLSLMNSGRPSALSDLRTFPWRAERRVRRLAGGEGRQPRDASCTSRWGTKGNRKLSLFICKTGVTWAKKRFLSGVCSVICCHSHFAYVGEGPRAAIVTFQRPGRENVYFWPCIVDISHFFSSFYILLKFGSIFLTTI